MELIYAALLIHKLGGKIDGTTLTKVIQAAGGVADEGKVKALVAALVDIDIEKAIKEVVIPSTVIPTAAHTDIQKKEEKKEEPKEDPDKAAQGLASLFG